MAAPDEWSNSKRFWRKDWCRHSARSLGSDHIKSSITIDYDPTSGESTQEVYDPNNSLVLSSQTSRRNGWRFGARGHPRNAQQCAQFPVECHCCRTSQVQFHFAGNTQRKQNLRSQPHHTTSAGTCGKNPKMAAAILVDDAIDSKSENGKIQETSPEAHSRRD